MKALIKIIIKRYVPIKDNSRLHHGALGVYLPISFLAVDLD